MNDLVVDTEPASDMADSTRPGFRLHRLEVMNWGTFDSRRGNVHVVPVDGETALLIGQNGSGKSTLVDALLTLLVKPGNTRNYNVAAGTGKRERDERSYLKGAYDRRSQEDDNRGEVQFLRHDNSHYSVLLAYFRNAVTGRVFTLAQILYLAGDGSSVEKLYCFAAADKSIAADCSGLRSMDKLAQKMQQRGFTKTTRSYAEYFEWFRKTTGVQPQAMDMFNQTVAVKDIHRLNDFLRKHMLEAKPWGEKVDRLLTHFQDLSDSHRDLLRVQKQANLLQPIAEHGAVYRRHAEELERTERLLAATDSYFQQKVLDLFAPACETKRDELKGVQERKQGLVEKLKDERSECHRIESEIEQAGGQRLRDIPLLIEKHQAQAGAKRDVHRRFHQALNAAGIAEIVENSAEFADVHRRLPALLAEFEGKLVASEERRKALIYEHGDAVRIQRDDEAELQALQQRQGNLPSWLADLRSNLCEELRLSERDLPFAAELIAVKSSERTWEPSIEMVLRSFALTLLVPQRHYNVVSSYVERTRLQDARGHGKRLVYHRVAERAAMSGPAPHDESLFRKLDFRDGHALLPWVKAELQERFNYRCCDTIQGFQQAPDKALTRERHVKFGGGRHEKNDRDEVADPRNYVLGWDNKEKRRRLAEAVQQRQQQIDRLDRQIRQIDEEQAGVRERIQAVRDARQVADFTAIDFRTDENEIAALQMEKKALEENNDTIRMLNRRLAEREQQITALETSREQLIRHEDQLDRWIADANRLIANNRRLLSVSQSDGSFARYAECFPELDAAFVDQLLSIENWRDRQEAFSKSRHEQRERLRLEIRPVEEAVRKAMLRYLQENPDDKLEFGADLRYLDDFLGLLERIRDEDLPKYEKRFKERLNEKVGQEVGVLRGEFRTDCSDIEDRIQLLNESLRNVEYRSGTHMRLKVQQVRDREIAEFRQALDECVSSQFDGTPEANEARYLRIEKLITRLREEGPWRLKVTDVRNWFDFAAVETVDETGEERSYHEDSSGQSGGEKAKLAFTILVAAIAYQYNLDPHRPVSDRFHFVVVDEMFSRIDDSYSKYALDLFQKFGLQLLIVAPLDAKARVTEPYVGCYLHVAKHPETSCCEVHWMTAREFQESMALTTEVA